MTVLDRLRAVVVVTTLAGVAALALSGLTPGGIAALAAVAVAAGAAASRRYPSHAGVRARQAAALAILVVVVLGVQPYLDQPRVALVPLSLGVAVVSSMLLDAVRDHVRAVALAVSLVLLAVATAPVPRLAVPFAVAWAGALVAVVLVGHVPPSDRRWTIAQTPAGRERVAAGRAGATVGLAIVTGLVAFLLVPPPEQWDQQRRAEEQGRATGQQPGTRSASAYSSGTLDMRNRGRLSDQPVLSVAPGAPALWRTGALGSYDGAQWFTTLSQAPRRLGGPEVDLRTPADPVPAAAQAAEADVRPLARHFSQLVTPGRPLSVRTPSDVVVRGDSVEFVGVSDRVAPYTVRYEIPVAAPPDVPVAATTPSVWTQLPPALPARVRALAEDTAGRAPDRASAVSAVERYLADNATYRLDSRVPGPGEDAVDAFLFTDRTGFCEQFAAAEVVLLRSVGVPARMAVGFAGGDAAGSDRRVLRERHAHAWVEVWYPDVGWVASDPTAGAVLADDSRGLLDRAAAAVQRLLSSARSRLAAALAVITLAVLGGLLLRRRTARGVLRVGGDGREAAARAGAVIDAYRRLEVALQAVGAPRAPAESLRELAVRVPTERSPHPLEVVERTCYAPADVPAHEALTAAAELDRISTALLAAREESRSGAG